VNHTLFSFKFLLFFFFFRSNRVYLLSLRDVWNCPFYRGSKDRRSGLSPWAPAPGMDNCFFFSFSPMDDRVSIRGGFSPLIQNPPRLRYVTGSMVLASFFFLTSRSFSLGTGVDPPPSFARASPPRPLCGLGQNVCIDFCSSSSFLFFFRLLFDVMPLAAWF